MVKNQEQKRIYIAYPYQSDYSDKNSQQYNSLSQLAAALTQEGHSVFCPMFQAHSLYQLEIDPRFKNHPFPRPWTGSFALDNHYQEFLELYTVK